MSEEKSVKYTEDELKEFVPLTCCKDIKDIYEINRLGEVRNKNTNKFISKIIEKDGYIVYSLLSNEMTENGEFISKIKKCHRLVALTFLKNDQNLPIVDHIDRNRSNNCITNLRWASFSTNTKNSKRPNTINSKIRYRKLDDFNNEIERLEIKEILNRYNISESFFRKCLRNKKKCCGFFWERIDIELENYINDFNIDLAKEEWRTWKRGNFSIECSSGGLLKNPKITTGNLNNHGYYRIGLKDLKNNKRKNFFAHIIIYEAFSGETLKKGEVIDHISTNKRDNRFINLRKCTQSNNLKNPITLAKKSIPILQYSIYGIFMNRFSSFGSAGKQNNIKTYRFSKEFVKDSNKISCGGYFWCTEGSELEIINKINNCIYCYKSKNDKLPENCTVNWKNHPSLKTCGKEIKNCILTGQPHPKTGYYYSLGLKNWETGEQIIPDVTPKIEEKEDQKCD